MNEAELREQVESMTEEEAADAILVDVPDWPDKITPAGSGETLTGSRCRMSQQQSAALGDPTDRTVGLCALQ